jgi:hypothetical protein
VVSANGISGSPATTFQRSGGIDLWQMKWLWDDQKRRLALTVIKSMRPVNADLVSGATEDTHEAIFEESRTDDKAQWDVRRDGDGRLEIWGGDAQWILGSELADHWQSFAEVMDQAPGQVVSVPAGPDRTYCVSFTWMSENKRRLVSGFYCKVFPMDQPPRAEEMLTALDLQFN